MKKIKRVLSLLVCVAMLASLFAQAAAAAVKVKGDVITDISFDTASTLDDLSASMKYRAYGTGKNGYTNASWAIDKEVQVALDSTNTDFELIADGTNKYLSATSNNTAGDAVIAYFTETTPQTNDDVFAVEFDLKMDYYEGGAIYFDMFSDSLKPTSYFKMGVTDEDSGYVEFRYAALNDSGSGQFYTQEERVEFPLGEFVNFRLELKRDRWVTSASKYGYNNYRLFINDNMVTDFKNLQINNSNMVLTKFQAAGFRAATTKTKYALDNIKFYELEELTTPALTSISVTTDGELEQYMDSASEIIFTATGNIGISDPENIEWYVNDTKAAAGATFAYTPDAVIGNYVVYAKYSDITSESITVVMNGVETLNEIIISSEGNLAQKGDLSEVTFTAEGNIEIENPENIVWYVNGSEAYTGESFSYTPTAGGSYEVKAVYEGIESNGVVIDVIFYADPTEPTDTETTVVFSALDGYPGVSSGDEKRFNKVVGSAVATVTDGENKMISLSGGYIDKGLIYPVNGVMLSFDVCLLAPESEDITPNGYMALGNSAAEADKYMKYTYDATSGEYILSVGGENVGSVLADEWFNVDVYLYASSNDSIEAAWNNARMAVTFTGALKDVDSNSADSIKTVIDREITSFNSANDAASIVYRICATAGMMYIDNYSVTYPGSFKLVSAEPETYGEGYGMKLDGKYYLTFNRNVDLATLESNISVSGSETAPEIYADLNNPETIVLDFAKARLSENKTYTIQITDGLKDVTGRHLLDKEFSFETKTDPSDEAYLSKLAFTVNDEAEQIPVNGFSEDIHEDSTYNVFVDNDTESITLIAEPANTLSTVSIIPEGGTVDLTGGSGSATVTVTSADGSKTVVHTINFTVSANKLVESVVIKPENLTVWADFKGNLTLTSEVLPETATDRSLVWTSDNEEAVKVDMAGKLILVGEGSATIRAAANDGSGLYDEMTVTVTPAKNRADDQKLNLDPTSTSRIDIAKHTSLPENEGDAQIAMWYNDAVGVFTLTVDDSIVKDFTYFKEFYDNYGVKTTMFVPVKYYSRSNYNDANMWTWADAQEGLTVQSHSYSHSDFELLGPAEVAADYIMAKNVLEQYITQPAEVVAYASGVIGDMSVSRELHIAGRGTVGTPNYGDKVNYMNTNSLSGLSIDPEAGHSVETAMKSIYTKDAYIYGKNYYGGWLSTHYHNLVNEKAPFANEILAKDKYGEDATAEQLASEEFQSRDALDYAIRKYIYPAIQAGKVWSATFAQAAKYGQERDTATLTMKNSSSDSYTFEITDEMDDTIFTHPLTVKIKVADDWAGVSAVQNEKTLNAVLKEIDGAKYVFVDAVPDKGDVVVLGSIDSSTELDPTVEITAVNGTVEAVVNGGEAQDWQSAKTVALQKGTKLTLTAVADDGAKFLYWTDKVSGGILSYSEVLELNVGTSRKAAAVFSGADEIYVTFRNINGTVVKSGLADDMTVPADPYVYGYEFHGWYLDGENQNFVAGSTVSVTENTMYLAGYTLKSDKYTITCNGEDKEYIYNEKAEYTAQQEKDSEAFSYWEKDGKIVSYDLTYSFYVSADAILNAVYGADEAADVIVVMANPVVVDTNRIAFFAERNIPEEYTVIETGIVMSKSADVTVENALYKAVAKSISNKGQFTVRKANVSSGETYYGAAYVIYSDSEGNIYTAYSNEVSKTL